MAYKKINITQARKLYQEHKDFIMVPGNMRPDCFMATNINATSFERLADVDFQTMVDYFEYYNCSAETGRKARFYIEE